jgi:phage-related protein
MKPVRFLGDSRKVLQEFPKDARQEAGYQLQRIQTGLPAEDFKPMHPIGAGVEEIRISEESGAYRVVYTARLAEAVYVLHAFQKKTRATSQRDVEIARERFRQVMRGQ